MNLITKLTYAIVPICGLIIVVALIYALIKYIKKKKEYKALAFVLIWFTLLVVVKAL